MERIPNREMCMMGQNRRARLERLYTLHFDTRSLEHVVETSPNRLVLSHPKSFATAKFPVPLEVFHPLQ